MTRPVTSAPPAALLRLRQGDVVRQCGFATAARGLEMADCHAVTAGRREGARLEARVAGEEPDDPPCEVRVALPDAEDGNGAALRWACSVHPSKPGDPGCAHVAALLTAWVRAPEDFPSVDAGPSVNAPEPSETSPPLRGALPPQVSQPRLIDSTRPARPRGEHLSDELERMPSAELLAMARRVVGDDLALHEARDALLATLSNSQALATLLDRLDPGPRMFYAALRLLGGSITANDLDAMAARGDRAPAKLRAEMAALTRHGLVFPVSGHTPTEVHDDGAHGAPHEKPRESARDLTGWRIPPEIRAAFHPRLPLEPLPTRSLGGPPVLPKPAPPAKARVVSGSPRPLVLALALLARSPAPLGPLRHREAQSARFQSGAVQFSLPGDLPVGHAIALARAAGLDPIAAILARRLILLAQHAAPAQPLTDLARVPASEHPLALRVGFALWREAEAAFELADLEDTNSPLRARVDATSLAFAPAAIAREVAAARAFVLRLLAAMQPGAWYSVDELLALVWRLDPGFLRGRQQTYATPVWWLERSHGEERRPLRANVREEWVTGEAEYLRRQFATTLHAWGMLDLAQDHAGALKAVRLTPLGAYLLAEPNGSAPSDVQAAFVGDWGTPALPTRSGDIAVQPLRAGATLLEALDRWMRVTGIAGGRLLYALDTDLAATALDRGAEVDELPARLRAADPQTGGRASDLVARRLGEWQAAYGATRIMEGWALLETRDEATLLEALALVPELAARCRHLDSHQVLVPPANLPALQAALARRGFTV